MEISYADYLKIMHPELRDPEDEKRRTAALERAHQAFPEPITLEALQRGIPVKIKPKREPTP